MAKSPREKYYRIGEISRLYKICDEKNILVNNITSKTDMNCRFGSIINNEEYTLGISAKGNPKKAKELREKLEKIL